MFSGRGFNIDTLNVAPTLDPKFSRITVTVKGDDQQLDQAIKQLNKLVNVIQVTDFKNGQYVARDTLMVKVKADHSTRSQMVQICDLFRARIVNATPTNIIAELTGDSEKLKAFITLLKEFDIQELVRTGNLALQR